MDDASLRPNQLRESSRLNREITATAVTPIAEMASIQFRSRYEFSPRSMALPASERLPVGATFARGDTSSAGFRERMPASVRVGLFAAMVILALAVALGVGMLLGLEFGVLLALLPR